MMIPNVSDIPLGTHMNVKHRRIFSLCLMACAINIGISNLAVAQMAKPLKMIVPFPAGGTADVLPRLLAEKMRAQFPAGVLVENKAGGATLALTLYSSPSQMAARYWLLRQDLWPLITICIKSSVSIQRAGNP